MLVRGLILLLLAFLTWRHAYLMFTATEERQEEKSAKDVQGKGSSRKVECYARAVVAKLR